MPSFRTEQLDKAKHERKHFTCGVEDLDRYLHQVARQAQEAGTAVCNVLVDPESPGRIVGYFTLHQHAVDPAPENAALFDRQPKVPRTLMVPATLLGRLAVDKDYQGQGIGPILLARALEIALAASGSVASVAVVVDPSSPEASRFYECFGFETLNVETGRLFMPMAVVAAHFEPADLSLTETI